MPYSIGVDLGGPNNVDGLADETGRLLARVHRPTAMPRSAEEIAVDIALCIEEMMAQSPAAVPCVRIGTPGSVNPQTGVVGFAGLTWQTMQTRRRWENTMPAPGGAAVLW